MRVYFHTFGCKANQYDTDRARQELVSRGAVAVAEPGLAEVCVVNTCTVTNEADAEARRFLRRLRRRHPRLQVVVAGCATALRPREYRAIPGVAAVVEGHDPVAVADATSLRAGAHGSANGAGHAAGPLRGSEADTDRRIGDSTGRSTGLVQLQGRRAGPPLLLRRSGGTRAWLKIQDGCDRKCSFCATRLARGASRSRPPDEIVAEAKLLARSHPELVLTGIHIGHYGRDLDRGLTLAELVARLVDEVPDVRFRLSSIEATEVEDRIVGLMAAAPERLAPHFHMPLQSGSDRILRRMRRWHTREQYRRRVLEIADRLPFFGLGADVIVGFPAETDDDHARTRALIEELPYTYLHVFPFSPVDGTPAAALPDRVPREVAAARGRELRELGLEKGRAYRARRVGQLAHVVLEGDGSQGLTEDYLRVAVRRRATDDRTDPATARPGALPTIAPASRDPARVPGSARAAGTGPWHAHSAGGHPLPGSRPWSVPPDPVLCAVLRGDGDHLYIELSQPALLFS